MRRCHVVLALSLVLTVAACRTDGSTPHTASAAIRDAAPEPPSRNQSQPGSRRGAPHSGSIDMLAVTRDGSAVVSHDHLGGLRLWPALDGSAEPLVVPLRGARDLAIERDGDELVIAAVDNVGAVHVLGWRDGEDVHEQAATPPIVAAAGVEILPGGRDILVLAGDRRMLLLDRHARVLAELEGRGFRPTAFRLADGGRLALAAEVDGTSVTLRRVAVTGGPTPSLTLKDASHEIEDVVSTRRDSFAVSLDGAHVAYFAPPKVPANAHLESTVAIVELSSGERRDVIVPLPSTTPRALGFTGRGELVARGSGTWRIDLEDGEATPLPSPKNTEPTRNADAFAAGLHVGCDGSWLFVQPLDDAAPRYLGYETFAPTSAALSPSGQHVAWQSSMGVVYLESLEGGRIVKLAGDAMNPYSRVVFVDEDHVITVDRHGTLALTHWPSGEVVARAGVGGLVDIEIDSGQGLLRIKPALPGAVIYEVDREGFTGPYLVADGSYRSGLITGSGDAVLWSQDSQAKLRRYTLADLRSKMSHADMTAKIDDTLSARVTQGGLAGFLAMDARARLYLGSGEGVVKQVALEDHDDSEETLTIAGSPNRIVPSPAGDRVAILTSTGILTVFDAERGEDLWSHSIATTNTVTAVVWSADGSSIALSAQVGAAVFDAATGDQKLATCGPWFESRTTPPTSTTFFTSQQNLCER